MNMVRVTNIKTPLCYLVDVDQLGLVVNICNLPVMFLSALIWYNRIDYKKVYAIMLHLIVMCNEHSGGLL